MISPDYTVVEPKICEECGANFLRDAGSVARYCQRHRWLEPVTAQPAITAQITPAPVTPEQAWDNLRVALAELN